MIGKMASLRVLWEVVQLVLGVGERLDRCV